MWYCEIASCQQRTELLDVLAGQGRDLQDRRVADEAEHASHLALHLEALLGADELPLVEHDHGRAAGGVDSLGQTLILRRDPTVASITSSAMSASSIARSARTNE